VKLDRVRIGLQKRLIPDIGPLDFQEVERAQQDLVIVQPAVQRVEVGNPVLVDPGDLSIHS
jgi:hypothetical protein